MEPTPRYWVSEIVPGVSDRAAIDRIRGEFGEARWCVVVDAERGVIAYADPEAAEEIVAALNAHHAASGE
ncbi:hypothetical protein [Cellulosimicrobium sp. TH-20]|uniref:hypothetical protein n=1 Tax=Cellulosimicrobium sp. TH-20 TaxID=1980001 RepID=UPI0011A08CD7|nr:hypothetical protein [Cellulosimicrobium sp. TH-20]